MEFKSSVQEFSPDMTCFRGKRLGTVTVTGDVTHSKLNISQQLVTPNLNIDCRDFSVVLEPLCTSLSWFICIEPRLRA